MCARFQLIIAFACCRYYCSKACQVSDWPQHKIHHKSLENSRGKQGSQLQQAIDSLVLSEDGEVESCSEPKDGNGMTALLRAASEGKWREVRKLILGRADPSVADCQGLAALHYAAILGSTELTRILIEHGPAGLIFSEAPGEETSL